MQGVWGSLFRGRVSEERIMRFIIALLMPPLATLLCGRFMQTILNVVLTLCLWVPGVLHAWWVIVDTDGKRRTNKLERMFKHAQRAG